jgi:hypothetical protein
VTDRKPSLSGVIETTAERVRDDAAIARAARVVSYDAEAQRADVQLIHDEARTRPDGIVEVVPAPILRGCPVMMLAGGGRSITFGLDVGDKVWVIVSDVSIDEWIAGQREGPYRPQDPRRFDLSDGIVWPVSDPPSHVDGQPVIAMGSGEALHIGDATAELLLARADYVIQQLADIEDGLNNHTHTFEYTGAGQGSSLQSGTTDGGGSYTAPGAASDIASSRVRVDD